MMKTNVRVQLLATITLSVVLILSAPAWSQRRVQIDPLSVSSLQLLIFHDGFQIGGATGFVVEKNNKHYLVTNRHVVLACGQNINDRANIGAWLCADKISIYHNRSGHLGQWFWVDEQLFDANHNKRWLEHPALAGAVDLVALPLEHSDGVQFYPLDVVKLSQVEMLVSPGETVSIVGFPLGLAQQEGLPIWKTGTIASDLDVDIGGQSTFLVDTTSRPGMSGAPVYAVRYGGYRTSSSYMMASETKFLGVYAEQQQAAELGRVWKADVVVTLYNSLP